MRKVLVAGATYIRAHETVVEELGRSGLSAAVVRPTGIFPIFDPFVTMARRGIAFIPGDGTDVPIPFTSSTSPRRASRRSPAKRISLFP